MKKSVFLYIGACIIGLMMACGGSEQPKNVEQPPKKEERKEICLYYHHDDSVNVHWVAYKHTAKAAVHGDFDSISILAKEPVKDIDDMIASASFTIYTSSTNSKDAARDKKIKASFFGKMLNTQSITGVVKSLEGSKATVAIKMNDVEKDIIMDYSKEGDRIKLEAVINVNDWNGQEALNSLNEVCSERHTGADGVNKLWDEVKVSVSTTLLKDCK
ncbi:MAG: YceI family protein [Flavobacteriales bacterium]|nr:YceI family protein [Flavobacteriales bacterium]